MKNFFIFMVLLFSVALLTGVITQSSTALDIESKTSVVLSNFVSQINRLAELGRSAFELFQKAVKALDGFWAGVKSFFDSVIDWFNWRAGVSF